MKHNYDIICLDSMFEPFLVADESMKHNYIIICLDSMFEAFCVVDEFVFLRFWDVFDVSLPVIQFRSEVTTLVV